MSRLLSLSLLALLFAIPVAYADDDAEAEPTSSTRNLFVGVGMFGEQINVNVEQVTRWGAFQYRAGRFSHDQNYGVNMSWRKPLESDDAHTTGFYLGLFGGQVLGEQINGKSVQRLGGGGEMGYHWVNDYTRKELTVGLGAAERIKERDVQLNTVPTLFISFTIALGT